jgi:hypothetical protein
VLKVENQADIPRPAIGKPITDSNRVNDIFAKFDSKYGGVKRYYPKVDVAVEVPL